MKKRNLIQAGPQKEKQTASTCPLSIIKKAQVTWAQTSTQHSSGGQSYTKIHQTNARTPHTWEKTSCDSPADEDGEGCLKRSMSHAWTRTVILDSLYSTLPEMEYYYLFNPAIYKVHVVKKVFLAPSAICP